VLSVRASIVTALTAGFVCVLASTAFAQSQSPVVVLDVSKVFKEHVRFKQELEQMANDAKQFQGYLQQQEGKLKALAEQRSAAKVGDPTYRQLDEEITRIQSEGQVQAQLKKKELMMREAKVYHQYYQELQGVVGRFCDEQKISLVIRWNSDPIDPENRVSVQQGVNNAIVFHRSLDITDLIIRLVNEGVPQQQARTSQIPGRSNR